MPRSLRNPQFNRETLPAALATIGIGYQHVAALGGFRRPHPDSPNEGWRHPSFRGYADYMATDAFKAAVADLLASAQLVRVALMCAEAVPWRCHRRLIADALLVRGAQVEEIRSPTRMEPHRLTPFARVAGTDISYPPGVVTNLELELDGPDIHGGKDG